MKTFVRDMIIGTSVFVITLVAMGWWSKPDYKGCATVRGQTLCYMVMK